MTKKAKAKGTLPALRLSPYQTQQLLAMVESTRARLLAVDPEMPRDGKLWADTLEGESDVIDLLREIGVRHLDAKAYAEACKARIEDIRVRQQRFENVAESNKSGLFLLMQAAELKNLLDPELTAFFSDKPPSLPEDVALEDVPAMYHRTTTVVNRALLAEHLKQGKKVGNIKLDNGGQTFTIKRK